MFKENAIWLIAKKYKIDLIFSLLALTIVSSSILGLGQALRIMIDNGFINNNSKNVDQIFMLIMIIIGFLSVASFVRSSKINIICDKIENEIKIKIYKHIVRLSPGFFEINKTSDVITRLTNDVNLMSSILTNISSSSIRNLLMLFGAIIFLFNISSKLTFYIIFFIPLIIIPIIFLAKKIRKLSRLAQDQLSLVNAHIEESINGIKTVQAFAREDYEIGKFNLFIEQALCLNKKRLFNRALLAALVIAIVLSSIAIVLWIGSYEVLLGKMTGGDLSSFIFYSVLSATSAASLVDSYSDIQRVKASLERINELLETKSLIIDPEKPIILNDDFIAEIEFKDITFSYPARPEFNSLQDTSFKINANEYIAIVGPSGAGKSSILQLLMRFYDPQAGEINIGNHNIKDISLNSLRNKFTIVPQDVVIFSASAYDNILFGDPSATREQVYAAAKKAEIYNFIMNLPEKFETFLGEKGVRISGGQKQRIAIARALLKDSPILLLDEATNSLDTENEQIIQQNFHNLRGKKTIILITHNLALTKDADKIIFINEGKVENIGKHEELLKNSELYNKLFIGSN